MPVMGGQEVAAELKQRSPDIPVLLMSGYNEDTAAGRTGIDANALFLNKPFTPESLIGKVRQALS